MSDIVERAKATLEAANDWTVYADWVCALVDNCTCDGPHDTYGHRPECGLAPIAPTSDPVMGFAADAQSLLPELVAEVERLRAEAKRAQDEGDWA